MSKPKYVATPTITPRDLELGIPDVKIKSTISNIEQTKHIEKTTKVKEEVAVVKEILTDNLKKALDRDKELEKMEIKTDDFDKRAHDFKNGAGKVKKMFCCRNAKLTALIVAIIVILILVIVLSLHPWTTNSN